MLSKNVSILLLLSLHVVISCGQSGDFSKIDFIPLHPYRASTSDYNISEPKAGTFVIKFFLSGAPQQQPINCRQELIRLQMFLSKETLWILVNMGAIWLGFTRNQMK